VDFFDFALSASDAAAFHFQSSYGPVISTAVFPQFGNVATNEGLLSFDPFDTSSDVEFSSGVVPPPVPLPAIIPEASTWAMMLLGFAGYRRESRPRCTRRLAR
jgi:hypothetical protein